MLLVIFAARADLAHVQLGAYKNHRIFSSRAVPLTVSPQYMSLQGVLPSQMQHFVGFQFHQGPCQPIPPSFKTLLDGSSVVKGCYRQIC